MTKDELKPIARRLASQYASDELNAGYKPAGLHIYHDLQGELLYFRIRLKNDMTGDKWIRPFHFDKNTNELVMREPNFSNGKPLYCLPEIIKIRDEAIWIFEGESCVDKATDLGITATTSGSSTSADGADWTPLSGKEIVIWPDNSEDGLIYADEVSEKLSNLNCNVQIIDIAKLNLPTKGDIVDWLECNSNAKKEDIFALPVVGEIEWPVPQPIQNELLPVQVLEDDLIPEPFRDFAKDVSDRMQCPIDFLVITILNVTASIIGTGCAIQPKAHDNWRIVPNLWGCIIGRPGLMKSPAVAEVMQFLSKLEAEAKKDFEERIGEYNVEMEMYKAEKDSIKDAIKKGYKQKTKSKVFDVGALRAQLTELKEPHKPIWQRFKTNDSTIEKLSELLAENPRGLLAYRDELIGLLKNCDKVGHEGDRSFFLESWNGDGSQTSDRISRGTVHAENLCLSIFGTTQPDRLGQYLYGAVNGDNDGLIQRFQLMVYPDEPKSWECVDRKPDEKARKRVADIIKKLSEANFIEFGAKKEESDRFPYFSFNDDAQQAFYEWWGNLERNKLRGDDHPIVIEHLSKYRKLMPALALIFYLIDRADGKEIEKITVEYVGMAADFCEYLETHARRIYARVTDIEIQAAALLCKKILQGKLKDRFSVRDIYRQKGLLKEKEIAQAACDQLVEAGWLREIVTPPAYQQKESITYLINPKIERGKNG